MLNEKIINLLNEQVNKEFYSAYLYLDIANFFIENELDGFGNWYNIQAMEEKDHAMLFIKYLQNNGEKVELNAITKPDAIYDSLQKPLELAYEHEKYITNQIHEIYSVAYEIKDFRTMQFLDWFVQEQGEEENNSSSLLKKFKLFGSEPKGLYLLNQELTARVYSAPSLVI